MRPKTLDRWLGVFSLRSCLNSSQLATMYFQKLKAESVSPAENRFTMAPSFSAYCCGSSTRHGDLAVA